MKKKLTEMTLNDQKSPLYSKSLSALGALGVGLQNYPAVDLFISTLLHSTVSTPVWVKRLTQAAALSMGGACSGLVNFWMNVELLDGFFNRLRSDYSYKKLNLTAWQKLQYFGGIFIFLVTGILFGLMAFTFAMTGPMAILSIAAGIFVAGIMTIQEIETWIGSYDQPSQNLKESLTLKQQLGKWSGHLIAIGNVGALSLLFTLGLAQSLIFIGIPAFPALITGLAIAFTFGAFTEYYFYNFYLSEFCKNLQQKWNKMLVTPNALLGIACISINAFVNTALTYTGILLLTDILIAAQFMLPPLAILTGIAAISAIFAGSASFILGTDFWIRQNPPQLETQRMPHQISTAKNKFTLFQAHQPTQPAHNTDQAEPFYANALRDK